jgi:glycosyltransferase involved in cell wall biosynthesis
MKTLLLIPSTLKTDVADAVRDDRHPAMDYHALADALRAQGDTVDLAGYGEAKQDSHPLVRMAHRIGGRDLALAMIGFVRGKQYDAVFTNSENLAIPLALLWKGGLRRPAHVTIGHRPSSAKKRVFFRGLRVQDQIDTLFVYASAQRSFAESELDVTPDRLRQIAFHADERFFRPLPDVTPVPRLVSAAGLEGRDYPTLISVMESLPDWRLDITASSPWSKQRNETEARVLPPNVSAKWYEYTELRDLYARSEIVAVPLYEADFQAGISALLEAMAMGKPVIVTRTTGQTDVITDGVTGLTVAPGDATAWYDALDRLHRNPELRTQLGENARRWVAENATLGRWTREICSALRRGVAGRSASYSSTNEASTVRSIAQ